VPKVSEGVAAMKKSRSSWGTATSDPFESFAVVNDYGGFRYRWAEFRDREDAVKFLKAGKGRKWTAFAPYLRVVRITRKRAAGWVTC
jgi:hypothetical protein